MKKWLRTVGVAVVGAGLAATASKPNKPSQSVCNIESKRAQARLTSKLQKSFSCACGFFKKLNEPRR